MYRIELDRIGLNLIGMKGIGLGRVAYLGAGAANRRFDAFAFVQSVSCGDAHPMPSIDPPSPGQDRTALHRIGLSGPSVCRLGGRLWFGSVRVVAAPGRLWVVGSASSATFASSASSASSAASAADATCATMLLLLLVPLLCLLLPLFHWFLLLLLFLFRCLLLLLLAEGQTR